MGPEMTLGDYLATAGRLAFDPCVHDCCTLPADWAVLRGRPDPMALWRGAYGSEAAAQGLIDEAGGLLALWRRGMAGAGIPEAVGLEPGDIGVVTFREAIDSCGIFTGRRWAIMTSNGLAALRASPVKAWRP